MKIVHVQDIFHPEAGYQENVVAKYNALAGNEVTVIASEIEKVPDNIISFFGKDNIKEKDEKYTKETGARIIRVPVYKYISGRAIYKEKVFKIIDKLEPDILFIHGNDTYIGMRYILKLNKLKYPVIYDNHMVDVASHNKLRNLYYMAYKYIFAKILIKNKVTVIRTENDDFVQNRLGVPQYLSPVIQFGSDLLLFKKDDIKRDALRKELGIPQDTFLAIYAGKLDEYKGGLFLAEAIEKKLCSKKDIRFMIIGNFVGEYGAKVKKRMTSSENKIYFLPTQKYIELPQYYQISDCMVMPKECSTTFFDAQACGLPCIAENSIQINVDRLSQDNGFCYKSGDIDDFRNKIKKIADLNMREYKIISENAIEYVKKNYNYAHIVDRLNNEMNKQIATWKSIHM